MYVCPQSSAEALGRARVRSPAAERGAQARLPTFQAWKHGPPIHYLYVYISLCIDIHRYICICTYGRMHTYLYIYVYIYICIVCVCVCWLPLSLFVLAQRPVFWAHWRSRRGCKSEVYYGLLGAPETGMDIRLMTETLHDLVYPKPSNSGSIV